MSNLSELKLTMATVSLKSVTLLKLLVLISISSFVCPCRRVSAKLTINAQTPSSVTDGTTPNTIVGVAGSTVASALLNSGTPAMLWGIITSDDVIAACEVISGGSLSLSAHVNHNWGDSTTDYTFQVNATGGCLAAPDCSGTEIVLQDQNGRRSAIVCPSTAGTLGCAIFVTGDDVNALHESASGRRRLLSDTTGVKLHSSSLALQNPGRQLKGSDDCLKGVITGAVVGVLGAFLGCFGFLIVVPVWCVEGVVVVSVAIGAAVECTGCFPGNALVELPGGYRIPVAQLSVGDKVAVWNMNEQTGTVSYEEVYAFGHKSESSISRFVKIRMEQASVPNSNLGLREQSSKTLEISPFHFLPTTKSLGGKVTHKRAKAITIGEYVWAAQGNYSTALARNVVPYVVTDISIILERGLFNPFTMGGTVLVDGVVASVHSEWFLDNTFDSLGMSHYLPVVYQVILSPFRVLFQMLGKEGYVSVYNYVDKHCNLAELGTAHGGTIIFGSIGTSLVIIGALLSSKTFIMSSR